MGKNKFYYFTINKATSSNYYKVYDYNEKEVKRLLSHYDEINDSIFIIYQGKTNIKYFILKNSNNLFKIGSFSAIITLKSNETINYNISNLFDYSSFGNLQVETKRNILLQKLS